VLTKTHCGSRCQDCSPEACVESFKDYMQQYIRAPSSQEYQRYEPTLVKKIVHLTKDPVDNIVSCYQCENKLTDENVVLNSEGFQTFCQNYDKHFTVEDERAFGPKLLELSKNVPCHGDFYRYVQRHNLAFETANVLRIEPFLVHLEDFEENHSEETISGVLKYLELPNVGPTIPLNWERTHDHCTKLNTSSHLLNNWHVI